MKSHLLWLLFFLVFLLYQPKAFAQHSEIGVKFVLSGAIMFGPYYCYWLDNHNELNFSVLAAFPGELVFPFALNAGYGAHFFNSKWRPQIGLQYSYLISPRRSKSLGDPNGISIISVVPGLEFRWDNTFQNAQSKIWFAHVFDKNPTDKNFKIFPIGLDISYGYKIH